MIWKLLFVFFAVSTSAVCGEKPCMPPNVYRFYRAWNEAEDDPLSMNFYRLPTDEEKRQYLYADYCEITPGKSEKPNTTDLTQICKWLIEDDPEENIPFVISYINSKDQEVQKARDQYLAKKKELEREVGAVIVPLVESAPNPLEHLIKFLNTDSEVLHLGSEWGIRTLFERIQDDPVEKKRCLNFLIHETAGMSNEGQRIIARTLYHLHQEGVICMSFEDI
jgi:hypothetical protein